MHPINLIYSGGIIILVVALLPSLLTGRVQIRQTYIVQVLSLFCGSSAGYFACIEYGRADLQMASLEAALVLTNIAIFFTLFVVRRRIRETKALIDEMLSKP